MEGREEGRCKTGTAKGESGDGGWRGGLQSDLWCPLVGVGKAAACAARHANQHSLASLHAVSARTWTRPWLVASVVKGAEGPGCRLLGPPQAAAARPAQIWAPPCHARAALQHLQLGAAPWEGTSSCGCGSCCGCAHGTVCCLGLGGEGAAQGQHPPQGCACSCAACGGCCGRRPAAAAAPSRRRALRTGSRPGSCASCAFCASCVSCASCASWPQTHLQQAAQAGDKQSDAMG